MDQATLIELMQDGLSYIGSHAMNAVTLIFAFLTMSYYVGAKLSRFQVWAVSGIYTGFYILPSFAAVRQTSILMNLIADFRISFPEAAIIYFPANLPSNYLWPIMGFMLGAAWVISIVFLIRLRADASLTIAS